MNESGRGRAERGVERESAPGGEDGALALYLGEVERGAWGAGGALPMQLFCRLLRHVQVPRPARLLHPRRCTRRENHNEYAHKCS